MTETCQLKPQNRHKESKTDDWSLLAYTRNASCNLLQQILQYNKIAIIKKGQIVYVDTMANVEKNHPEGLEEFYMNTIRDNGDLDE